MSYQRVQVVVFTFNPRSFRGRRGQLMLQFHGTHAKKSKRHVINNLIETRSESCLNVLRNWHVGGS